MSRPATGRGWNCWGWCATDLPASSSRPKGTDAPVKWCRPCRPKSRLTRPRPARFRAIRGAGANAADAPSRFERAPPQRSAASGVRSARTQAVNSMKRVLIILPLLAIVADVASAQMLQPSVASPAVAAPAVASPAPSAAKGELPPPLQAETPPPRVAPTLVARQAPVPMLLTSRPPALAPAAPGAESGTAEATSRHLSEANAKVAIEADGYRMPRMVAKGPDGAWRARALRGTVEVSLRVDAQGNVSSE